MIVSDLEIAAKKARIQILDMSLKAKNAHLGGALSCVEIITALYIGGIMKYDVNNTESDIRDRFILSKGHGAMAHYAVLNQMGFISDEELSLYHSNGYFLAVHPQMNVKHGIEASGGSLGQGVSFGSGIALALKLRQNSAKVYVVVGDGELNEGSNWEAFAFASHNKLDNLTVICDCNRLQLDGHTSQIVDMFPLTKKIKAFGFDVTECNGHDFNLLLKSLAKKTNKPKCIIAKTTKGNGVSFAENAVSWHYNTLTQKLYDIAIAEVVK
jgi:transketolase